MTEKLPLLMIGLSVAVLISTSGAQDCQVPSAPGLFASPVTYQVTFSCQAGFVRNSSFASDVFTASCQSSNIWDNDVTQLCVVDRCASNPCQNNATCESKNDGFECACQPGFIGTTCAEDFNDCASAPCVNNATCVDKVNAFECTCPPGYSGTTCSKDIDECASNPCQNNATCVNKINEFQCTCQSGYAGTTCSEVITTPSTTSAAGYSSWSYQHKSVMLLGSTLVSTVMMMMMLMI